MDYIIVYKQNSFNSRLGRTLIVCNSLQEKNKIKGIEHKETRHNLKT